MQNRPPTPSQAWCTKHFSLWERHFCSEIHRPKGVEHFDKSLGKLGREVKLRRWELAGAY